MQHPGMPDDTAALPAKKKRKRGFAAMSKEMQRALSSKGGKSQNKMSNPANFAHHPFRASQAGARGGRISRIATA